MPEKVPHNIRQVWSYITDFCRRLGQKSLDKQMAHEEKNPSGAGDVDQLRLERRRLRIETLFRRKELQLERQKLKVQQAQFRISHRATKGWGVVLTPTGAAVGGAIIALVATAATKVFDLLIEQKRDETSVILKASDVPASSDENFKALSRARNLLWFQGAGYIHLPNKFLKELQETAKISPGQIPPPPSIQSGATSSDESYWHFPMRAEGEDIVIENVIADWFGGPNDPISNSTASGIDLRAQPGFEGCALPMAFNYPRLSGSPIPKLPWKTIVHVESLDTDSPRSLDLPLLDVNLLPKNPNMAVISLTPAAFYKLSSNKQSRTIRVSFRIIGGAKFLSGKATPGVTP